MPFRRPFQTTSRSLPELRACRASRAGGHGCSRAGRRASSERRSALERHRAGDRARMSSLESWSDAACAAGASGKRDGHDDDPSHRRQVSVGTSGRVRVGGGGRAGCLRAEGFFEGGAEGLVADVFLGYGLSSPLRRTAHPTRPSRARCRGPQCRSGRATDPPEEGGAFRIGAWERTWTEEEYGGGGRGRAGRDRGRRRLPGQPRPAPLRAVRGRPASGSRRRWRRCGRSSRGRSSARAGRSCPPRRSCCSPAAAGGSGRSRSRARARSARAATSRLREGRGRERDDRGPRAATTSRASASRASVRWPELHVERPLAGVVHLVSTRRGGAARGRRFCRADRRRVPWRVDDGRAEDLGARPHRRARAGRDVARRWARSAASIRTATSTSR